MTSKLKCPFCGEEIFGVPNLAQTRTIGFRCCNIQCQAFSHFMPVFLLQALIQAKQDLEIAKNGLRVVSNQYRLVKPKVFSPRGDMATLCAMGEVAEKVLEQIEHKE